MLEKIIASSHSQKQMLMKDGQPNRGIAMSFQRYKEQLEKGFNPVTNENLLLDKVIPQHDAKLRLHSDTWAKTLATINYDALDNKQKEKNVAELDERMKAMQFGLHMTQTLKNTTVMQEAKIEVPVYNRRSRRLKNQAIFGSMIATGDSNIPPLPIRSSCFSILTTIYLSPMLKLFSKTIIEPSIPKRSCTALGSVSTSQLVRSGGFQKILGSGNYA